MIEKPFLTDEQRKCHVFVQNVICQTINRYGSAMLDCGHVIDGKTIPLEIMLLEMEDETFVALCPKCGQKGGKMPYAIRGNTVIKKTTGKVVGHSKNPKKYLAALQMAEHNPEAMRKYKPKQKKTAIPPRPKY